MAKIESSTVYQFFNVNLKKKWFMLDTISLDCMYRVFRTVWT